MIVARATSGVTHGAGSGRPPADHDVTEERKPWPDGRRQGLVGPKLASGRRLLTEADKRSHQRGQLGAESDDVAEASERSPRDAPQKPFACGQPEGERCRREHVRDEHRGVPRAGDQVAQLDRGPGTDRAELVHALRGIDQGERDVEHPLCRDRQEKAASWRQLTKAGPPTASREHCGPDENDRDPGRRVTAAGVGERREGRDRQAEKARTGQARDELAGPRSAPRLGHRDTPIASWALPDVVRTRACHGTVTAVTRRGYSRASSSRIRPRPAGPAGGVPVGGVDRAST